MFKYYVVLALIATQHTLAQDFDFAPPRPAPPRLKPNYSGPSAAPRPTPVPIIKQIDRHNDDGSYTYGYESADGSFKIETKLPTGEVKGKYGYVDDVGKVRVVEYGATKYGFAPAGEGITIPPPTLVDETTDKNGELLPEYDYEPVDEPQQGSLRAQSAPKTIPASTFEFSSGPAARPAPRPAPRPVPRPAPIEYSAPQTFEPAPRAPAPSPSFSPLQEFNIPSRPAPKPAFSPAPAPPRPVFANAAPLPVQSFGPPSRPAPAPKFGFAQEAAPLQSPSRPPPQPSFAPAPRPAPQYRPAPKPSAGRPSGGSILDQLSKDYALPQGDSAPLHDISFGYY